MGIIYDYVIIGGGLSGLFFAYKLLSLDSKLKVLILEKNNRVGGRMNSVTIGREGGILEMGHDVINPDLHPLLNDFLNKSGLVKQTTTQVNNMEYLLANQHYQTTEDENFPFNTDGNTRPDLLIQNSYQGYLNSADKQGLYHLSTWELLEQVVTPDQLQFIKTTYPFWSLLHSTNAEEGDKLIRNMSLDGRHYCFKKGISQITKYLVKQLTKWGCLIKLDRKVTLLNESPELTHVVVEKPHKKHQYYTKKTILALPPMAIKGLNTLNFGADCFSLLDNFVTVPTCKVFFVFPKQDGKFWFSSLPNLLTGNYLNYLIPICPKAGIFMVSYTEGQQSIPIFEAQLEGRLVKYVLRHLQALFPNSNIPKPIYHEIIYKKIGRYLIPPGIEGNALKTRLSHPTKLPIYLIGDSYSQNVDCLEGSLETALAVLLDIYHEDDEPTILLDEQDDLEMVPPSKSKIEEELTQRQGPDQEPMQELTNVVSMEISKDNIDNNDDDIEDLPIISSSELEIHNHPNDAWIGLFGYVYQITNWLLDHHNYKKWLINGLGKDYSLEFQNLINYIPGNDESYPNLQELQQSLIKTIIGKLKY